MFGEMAFIESTMLLLYQQNRLEVTVREEASEFLIANYWIKLGQH